MEKHSLPQHGGYKEIEIGLHVCWEECKRAEFSKDFHKEGPHHALSLDGDVSGVRHFPRSIIQEKARYRSSLLELAFSRFCKGIARSLL